MPSGCGWGAQTFPMTTAVDRQAVLRDRPSPLVKYPFIAVHGVAVVGAIAVGWSWAALLWLVGTYLVRMFAITGGYHRYFAHRTFKTSRVFQFVLALLAMSSAQQGVLWW